MSNILNLNLQETSLGNCVINGFLMCYDHLVLFCGMVKSTSQNSSSQSSGISLVVQLPSHARVFATKSDDVDRSNFESALICFKK